MKIVKEIYMCDICNNEVNKDDLSVITLPYKTSDCEGRSYFDDYKQFELCPKCKEKYNNLVFSKFAVIKNTLGNVTVELK